MSNDSGETTETTSSVDSPVTDVSVPVKRQRGRPKKSEIAGKRPVGRPKGEAAVMQEYKRRMLASPKSEKVMNAIFNAALDDDHKNQAAAWKLLADRLFPVSLFEQDIKRSGGKSSVNISITGISDRSNVTIDGEAGEDAEYTEMEDT